MSVVLTAQDIHKSYGQGAARTLVLRGVDLSISRGEVVFLVGPSGSGKSTLLSILGCLLTPDAGSIRVFGVETRALPPDRRAQLRRDRIGFLFQRCHLIRGLSALENVCIPLTLQGVKAGAAAERGRALLEAVGLAEKATADPRTMSVGQCQRVALARALAGRPELVLADEPTASLDAEGGERVMQLLCDLAKNEATTLIIVTHDHRILRFADRVLRLDDGCIAPLDTPLDAPLGAPLDKTSRSSADASSAPAPMPTPNPATAPAPALVSNYQPDR